MRLPSSALIASAAAWLLLVLPLVEAQMCASPGTAPAGASALAANVNATACQSSGQCCSALLGWCTTSADACNSRDQCAGACNSSLSLLPAAEDQACPDLPAADSGSHDALLASFEEGSVFTITDARASQPARAPKTASSRLARRQVAGNQTATASLAPQPSLECSADLDIDACTLARFMGHASLAACPYCSYYAPHVDRALKQLGLACAPRAAAFLAQVRHETAGLNRMVQIADWGAGALHLLPLNYALALRAEVQGGVPGLRAAVDAALADSGASVPAAVDAGLADPQVAARAVLASPAVVRATAAAVARADLAFTAGAWWFATGAAQSLGWAGCSDLRIAADAGLGSPSATPGALGTGFYAVAPCVFGIGAADPGWAQRFAYAVDALDVAARVAKVQAEARAEAERRRRAGDDEAIRVRTRRNGEDNVFVDIAGVSGALPSRGPATGLLAAVVAATIAIIL